MRARGREVIEHDAEERGQQVGYQPTSNAYEVSATELAQDAAHRS